MPSSRAAQENPPGQSTSAAASSAQEQGKAKKTQTLAAFHHSAFRLFFAGQLVSLTGTWMQTVAQQIVVYNLTRSQLALGLVALAQGIPTLFLAPVAGVLVERYPRRTILVGTQIFMMTLALIMALLYFTGVLQIWHIMLLSFGLGIANAIDAPARLSFMVEMVGQDDLPSAIVMNSLMFNVARIVGPAIGGVALASLGPSWCFLLNGLSFVAVILGLLRMRIASMPISNKRIEILRPLIEGLRFARNHPTIGPLLLLSALTSTFGLTFTVLLPPFADKVLGNTEVGTSALLTAQGIGALAASVLVARLTNSGRRGQLLTMGALTAPVALLGLAFTNTLPVAAALVLITGFGYICQFVLTNTLLQLEVPNAFRGRVMSLYSLTFFGLTPFGSLIIGSTAQVISTVPAILIFALLNLLGSYVVLSRAAQVRQLP